MTDSNPNPSLGELLEKAKVCYLNSLPAKLLGRSSLEDNLKTTTAEDLMEELKRLEGKFSSENRMVRLL